MPANFWDDNGPVSSTSTCEIYAACDAAYLDMPLAEILYNAGYNESYTYKTLGVC